jgi:hypothetical protein
MAALLAALRAGRQLPRQEMTQEAQQPLTVRYR